jgi:hypothetical protein
VKLGAGAVQQAAASLLRFAANVDTAEAGPPAALNVITGMGLATRLPSGVNVVPVTTLTA